MLEHKLSEEQLEDYSLNLPGMNNEDSLSLHCLSDFELGTSWEGTFSQYELLQSSPAHTNSEPNSEKNCSQFSANYSALKSKSPKKALSQSRNPKVKQKSYLSSQDSSNPFKKLAEGQKMGALLLQQKSGQRADASGKVAKKSAPLPKKQMTLQFLMKAKQFFVQYDKVLEQGLVNTTNSMRKFANENGYLRSTVYYLYQRWQEDPQLIPEQQCLLNGTYNSFNRNKNKLTNYRMEILFRLHQSNPLLSSQEIVEIVERDPKCQRIDSEGNVYKMDYKAACQIYRQQKMKKVPLRLISTMRNDPDDLRNRKIYCQRLVDCINIKYRIFYLDEMAINRWVGKDKVWIREGQNFPNVMANLKKESFLLVSIMDGKGAVKFEVIHGSSSNEKYEDVLDRLLEKMNDKYPQDEKVLVIPMTVGAEHSTLMQSAGEKKGFGMLLLPLFSSQLNPLEDWFIQIRNLLKREKFSNDMQLIHATRKVINFDLKNKSLPNFTDNLQQFINKGLKGEPFIFD